MKEVGGKAVLQTLVGKEDVHFDTDDLIQIAPDTALEFEIMKQVFESCSPIYTIPYPPLLKGFVWFGLGCYG